jgi:hypothetical protein
MMASKGFVIYIVPPHHHLPYQEIMKLSSKRIPVRLSRYSTA